MLVYRTYRRGTPINADELPENLCSSVFICGLINSPTRIVTVTEIARAIVASSGLQANDFFKHWIFIWYPVKDSWNKHQ
jgi:hypothetical protein